MRKLLVIDNCEDCCHSIVRYDDNIDYPGISLYCEYGNNSVELWDDVPGENCPLPDVGIWGCIKLLMRKWINKT